MQIQIGERDGALTLDCGGGRDECACTPFDLHDQPELAANILDAAGNALLNRGCLDEARPAIEKARALRLKFFGKDHPAFALSQNSYSRLRRERGDYKAAEAAARDALRINREAYGTKSLPFATSLYHLGANQLDQGNFDAAAATAAKGLKIMECLEGAAGDPNLTRLLEVRGRAELNLGKISQAAATYAELLDRDAEELGTREHFKYFIHLGNLGAVEEARGHRDHAERAYREAIEFFVQRFKRPCHPVLIDLYANLGSLLRSGRDPRDDKEAGEIFRKALALDQKVRGAGHVLVANDHANLGRWQYDSKDLQGALASFTTALDIYEQNLKEGELPPEHFFLAEARTWKGRILVEAGTADGAKAAQPLLQLAVTHWPAELGPDSVGEGIAKACLGRALFLQGRPGDAACDLLCAGYAIVKRKCPDTAFVDRVKGWVDAQKCQCDC